jgi:hypothetical protein
MTDEEFMLALAKAMPSVFKSDKWARESCDRAYEGYCSAKMVNRHVPGSLLVLDIWWDGTWWNYEFEQKADYAADLEGTWFEHDGFIDLPLMVEVIRRILVDHLRDAEREFDRAKALYAACFG